MNSEQIRLSGLPYIETDGGHVINNASELPDDQQSTAVFTVDRNNDDKIPYAVITENSMQTLNSIHSKPPPVYGELQGTLQLGDENMNSAEEDKYNCCQHGMLQLQKSCSIWYRRHRRAIKLGFLFLLGLAYIAYFSYAMYFRFGDEGSIRLLVVTSLIALGLLVFAVKRLCRAPLARCCVGCMPWLKRHGTKLSWAVVTILALGSAAFVVVDVTLLTRKPYNLVSGGGLLLYVFLFFVFSYNPAKVSWRPVVWGIVIQMVLGVLILRTSWGYAAFKWLGDRVTEFLDHTDAGAEFVFGIDFREHYFAFRVLAVIIFFSSIISVLYHLGVMQFVIRRISFVMQAAMGTTPGETLNAAGNMFVGMSEAPLMIRPLLQKMTRSELHAVMTGGFATVAGSTLGAYIGFGVPANHLLTASVLSAPAALAMAKLFYPETTKSATTADDVKHMDKGPEKNIIEAAANGATSAVKLAGYVAANLIAFISILHFVNATLTWLGMRVGLEPPNYEYLTFEFICSYLLLPFAFVMGVDLQDSRKVAELIGLKTFLNEFVAYEKLGKLIQNRDILDQYNGTVQTVGEDLYLVSANTTLAGGVLSDRSQVIATYALCGFANVGSIGIMLGALGAIIPKRKSVLAQLVVRAMIAGNVACFMTACVAGLFYQGPA